MLANLNGWHALLLLVVVLLLFGAPRIPALARSVGQSLRIFKSEVHEAKKESAPAPNAAAAADGVDASIAPVGAAPIAPVVVARETP